jgi:hypothetical protein
LKAEGQESSPPPVGEEAKVANADKAFGKHMQEEAAQELIEGEGQHFLLIVMSAVAPAKGNLVIDERNESMIGDGDAMGVAA